MSRRAATLIGLTAILLWSAAIGLMRMASQNFGTTFGPACLYTIAAVILWLTRRPGTLRALPVKYMLVCGGLFIAYEISLSIALGLAANPGQAIQVSTVNHLWPTMTVLLVQFLSRRRGAVLIAIPGAIIATVGIVCAVGGDHWFDLPGMIVNIHSNPAPYALAFGAAIIWALYSVMTPRLSGGRDAIAVFFTAVSCGLWIIHATIGTESRHPHNLGAWVLLALGAFVIAIGYACWNFGLVYGNMRVISMVSYSQPVLSAATASIILGTTLALPFWTGLALVVTGSAFSLIATQHHEKRAKAREAVREALAAE